MNNIKTKPVFNWWRVDSQIKVIAYSSLANGGKKMFHAIPHRKGQGVERERETEKKVTKGICDFRGQLSPRTGSVKRCSVAPSPIEKKQGGGTSFFLQAIVSLLVAINCSSIFCHKPASTCSSLIGDLVACYKMAFE